MIQSLDSRRRPHESAESVHDRKAFRVCINENDCQRFLYPSFWPDSISVSEWFFKQQSHNIVNNGNINSNGNINDKRRKLENDNAVAARASVEVDDQAAHPSSNAVDQVAAAAAAAVAVVAGSPSRPTAENISMSDEETILESCPLPQ